MTQSRLHSMVEAWVNTFIGFMISLALQFVVSWLYDLHTTPAENLSIVLIFTVASVVRSYAVRRIFNRLHNKNNKGAK